MAEEASAVRSIERKAPAQWLVRAGFAARGLTYGIIGGLALALALGAGGGATNQQGALTRIASGPLGKLAVLAVAVGLLAYAAWKLTLAWIGRGPEGGGGEDWKDRVSNLGGGVSYLGFFGVAVGVLVHAGSNQSRAPSQATAGAFGWPGGRWLVGIAGAVLIVICAVQAYDALKGGFLDESKTGQMRASQRATYAALGRIGLISRAAVFTIVGYFLIRSAIDFNPHKAVSVDGALRRVADEPYGSWLLGLIATGIVLFALFSFAEARYRRL